MDKIDELFAEMEAQISPEELEEMNRWYDEAIAQDEIRDRIARQKFGKSKSTGSKIRR